MVYLFAHSSIVQYALLFLSKVLKRTIRKRSSSHGLFSFFSRIRWNAYICIDRGSIGASTFRFFYRADLVIWTIGNQCKCNYVNYGHRPTIHKFLVTPLVIGIVFITYSEWKNIKERKMIRMIQHQSRSTHVTRLKIRIKNLKNEDN